MFSDSQSAVGILTLGWQRNSHKQVIAEINQTLKSLEKEQIQINLKWTPGHAEITGNEIADQLAKAAAEEAERMPEVTYRVTALDIKIAVQESCNIKWQKRWEAGVTGRQLFDLRSSVNVRLNEYRYKTGLQDSPNCRCGDPESVQHFIEDCALYDDIRERLRTRLFYSCRIKDFSAKTFLEVSKDNPLKPFRDSIDLIFEDFLSKTKRFVKQ